MMGDVENARTGSTRVAAALNVLLFCTVFVATIVWFVPPAFAADYPTWGEVEAAKQNAATAQRELVAIQSAVTQLQADEAAAADAELKATYAATVAANALEAAQAQLGKIDAQLSTARSDAAAATTRSVSIEVHLARLGGGNNLTAELIASGLGSGDLLGRLTALSDLGRHTAATATLARQKRNVVTSLESQSARAEKLRNTLKVDADAKAQAAQAARVDAQAKLAAGQRQLTVLTQQAAALNGEVATIVDQYNAGQLALLEAGGPVTGIDTSGVVVNPAAAQAYARGAIGAYGWGSSQFTCLVKLWTRESSWRANAYNASSGAYGIPQSLPASKMATAGADWATNANTQINWGLSYISRAYGTPCGAWAHETSIGWY